MRTVMLSMALAILCLPLDAFGQEDPEPTEAELRSAATTERIIESTTTEFCKAEIAELGRVGAEFDSIKSVTRRPSLSCETQELNVAEWRAKVDSTKGRERRLSQSFLRAAQGKLQQCRNIQEHWDRQEAREAPFTAKIEELQDKIIECRRKAVATVAERQRTAGSKSLGDLRAIEPRQRLEAEDVALAKAEVEHEEVLAQRRSDKKFAAPILSAGICAALESKRGFAAEIKVQRRYAKQYGGVVDLKSLYELQREIREMDVVVRESKQMLRRLKARPLGCRHPEVLLLARCLAFGWTEATDKEHASCGAPFVKQASEIADMSPF